MRPALLLLLAVSAAVPEDNLEEQHLQQLLSVRRVYVDRLSGGESAAQVRDMIISSLQGVRLFIVTENADRADAILRGSGEDLVFTETHSSTEGVRASANLGASRSSRERAYGGVSLGENESSHSSERRHEAVAAVRLVNKEGDVIWSTTQESTGAKFRGASADVAEKVVRTLKSDFDRARMLRTRSEARPAIPLPGL